MKKNKNQENREYKDSVFSDLFYSDRDARKNLLELYNALYDEKLTDDNEIQLVRITNVLFAGIHNDSAFTVKNRRIILSEHQSTINENMPLRDLLYIGTEYERYEAAENRYKRKRITIPTPDFFTFYNGTEPYPTEIVLKLSDSYEDQVEPPNLELFVKVININMDAGHVLLSKCRVLREYSLFVETVRRYKKKGSPDSIERAIYECIEKGILKDYLERKGREVRNMLFAEYDHDMEMKVYKEELREDLIDEVRAEVYEKAKKDVKQEVKEEVKQEVKEEVKQEVEEQVKQEINKEKRKNIVSTIDILKDLGLSVSEIKSRIMEKLNLSEEEALSYIQG
ncbi:MAG: hypothetical protein IJX67_07300 [Oscillospiraceae bacterium]|nr:hypothetical protein [Oscillospiraceae bacterium]